MVKEGFLGVFEYEKTVYDVYFSQIVDDLHFKLKAQDHSVSIICNRSNIESLLDVDNCPVTEKDKFTSKLKPFLYRKYVDFVESVAILN